MVCVLAGISAGADYPDGYHPGWFPDYSEGAEETDRFDFLDGTSVRSPARLPAPVPEGADALTVHGVPFRVFGRGTIPGTQESLFPAQGELRGRDAGEDAELETLNGTVKINLPAGAREALLLLRAEIPQFSVIHRGRRPMYLWRLSEPHYVRIEVDYADGTRDTLIPYNLELEDYGLAGGDAGGFGAPGRRQTGGTSAAARHHGAERVRHCGGNP
jgi:hypothetical protein